MIDLDSAIELLGTPDSYRRALGEIVAAVRIADDPVACLRIHRLAGHLRAGCPELPATGTLAMALKAEAGELQHSMDRLQRQRRELAAVAPGTVVLKGETASTILGSAGVARISTDIDIVDTDLAPFLALDYTCVRPPAPHESATLTHPRLVTIDVHRHFPVWRIADGALQTFEIPAATLLSQSRAYPAQTGWHHLEPELAAVVSAAHMYKTFVEYPVSAGMAKMKLAELLELVQLVSSSHFDRARFRELTFEHRADQAVSFSAGAVAAFVEQVAVGHHGLEVTRGVLVEPEITAQDLLSPARLFQTVFSTLCTTKPPSMTSGQHNGALITEHGEVELSTDREYELRLDHVAGSLRIRPGRRGLVDLRRSDGFGRASVALDSGSLRVDLSEQLSRNGGVLVTAILPPPQADTWAEYYADVSAQYQVMTRGG